MMRTYYTMGKKKRSGNLDTFAIILFPNTSTIIIPCLAYKFCDLYSNKGCIKFINLKKLKTIFPDTSQADFYETNFVIISPIKTSQSKSQKDVA